MNETLPYKDALARVKTNGLTLVSLPHPLRHQREIILAALKQNGDAFQYTPIKFKKDRQMFYRSVNYWDRCPFAISKNHLDSLFKYAGEAVNEEIEKRVEK